MIQVLDKKSNRQFAKKMRAQMVQNGLLTRKSSIVVSKILSSTDFKNAKNIALYFPLQGEIDITNLLKIEDKNFYLPRCHNLDLEFVKYVNHHSLVLGSFNIMEPLGESVEPEILDLIYIPALMANKRNYRLGYGKGYYDRFFSKNNCKAKKIIVVPNELISDDFKEEDNDYICDSIISA